MQSDKKGYVVLRGILLAASRSPRAERLAKTAPLARSVVRRYVAGEDVDSAAAVTRALTNDGLLVTIDHLGEDITERSQAEQAAAQYVALLERLRAEGLADRAEVSVKLSALGQKLGWDGRRPSAEGEKIAKENAFRICSAACEVGTTVTLDMEDHDTVESTLLILSELRKDFPSAGAVIQSALRDAEEHCRELAVEGSRVRLCKGAYNSPPSVAFQSKQEIDLSYVRCMRVLMAGPGYPMLATHDPRLLEMGHALAVLSGRESGSFEYQMLYGVRPKEQRRLAETGAQMRVYVPYGDDWYGYLMRRLAERPANLMFFLRSLIGRG